MWCVSNSSCELAEARAKPVWTIMMGRAGWLRGLLLVACLAGGDAYVVPTSQHVLQLAARRAAPPPPRAPSTTASPESEWYISHVVRAVPGDPAEPEGVEAPPPL